MKTIIDVLTSTTAAYTTSRPDVTNLIPHDAIVVLDVGCSNGALGASLRATVSERRVVGIERNERLAHDATFKLNRVIHANLECFDWHTGLDNERFDCIVFADILEHLTDPYFHISGALANLKPTGCIVISLPNIRHISALREIYVRGRFPHRERGLFDATHLRWFSISDGRELLEKSGLMIEADGYALRIGDQGGGRINRLLNRLPMTLQRWFPVREFLTYQFCLRARRSTEASQITDRVCR